MLAGLAQGLQYELRMFHATFASADQKEGMAAFSVSLRQKSSASPC